jgi:hypothetical protein
MHAPAFAMHPKQVMSHIAGQEYAAMQSKCAAEQAASEASARDAYSATAAKWGQCKDAGKPVSAHNPQNPQNPHNPYAAMNISHMMGNAGVGVSTCKLALEKGPTGKPKSKPPRASTVGSVPPKAISNPIEVRKITSDPSVSLGATKSQKGTRVVQGKKIKSG